MFLLDGDSGEEEFCLDCFAYGDAFAAARLDVDLWEWKEDAKSDAFRKACDGCRVIDGDGLDGPCGFFSFEDESSVDGDAPSDVGGRGVSGVVDGGGDSFPVLDAHVKFRDGGGEEERAVADIGFVAESDDLAVIVDVFWVDPFEAGSHEVVVEVDDLVVLPEERVPGSGEEVIVVADDLVLFVDRDGVSCVLGAGGEESDGLMILPDGGFPVEGVVVLCGAGDDAMVVDVVGLAVVGFDDGVIVEVVRHTVFPDVGMGEVCFDPSCDVPVVVDGVGVGCGAKVCDSAIL